MRIGSESPKPPAANGRSAGSYSKKLPAPPPFKHLLNALPKGRPVEAPSEKPNDTEALPPEAVRRARREGEREEAAQPALVAERPVLDPLVCTLSHPKMSDPAVPMATPAVPIELPVEMMLERLVRRVAVGGTGKRGTARLELGAGGLDGTTITIHADDMGEVSVEVELAPGARGNWHDGLKEKLERRGLSVKSVDVR